MVKTKGKKTIIYKGSVRKAGETFIISDTDIEAFKTMGFEIQEEIVEADASSGTGNDKEIYDKSDNGGDDEKTDENNLPPNNGNPPNDGQTETEQKTEFVCPQCDKKYASKSSLTAHMKTHEVKAEV